MSHDPHAPTPAGPDPDEPTEIRPLAEPAPVADADPTAPVATPAAGVASPLLDDGGTLPGTEPTVGPAPQDDWLTPDPVAAPAPDPFLTTPSAFTPPGTPEPGGDGVAAQAQALTDRPEVMVALAFARGVLASLVLKRLGR